MNLKEFLKPNWKKVLLTIIFAIFSFWFLYNYTGIGGPRYEPNLLFTIVALIAAFLNLPLLIPNYNPLYETAIFYFILDLIYWYLLSCLIIWIYDKVKKK